MILFCLFKWIVGIVFGLIGLVVFFIVLVGWNWLCELIECMILEKMGCEFIIGGDLMVEFVWL